MPRFFALFPATALLTVPVIASASPNANGENSPVLTAANVIVPTPITPVAKPLQKPARTATTMTPRKTTPPVLVASHPAPSAPPANSQPKIPVTETPAPRSVQAEVPAPRPIVAAPVAANPPKIAAKNAPAKPTEKRAAPSQLASREAQARQLLLARLDADLARAQSRLEHSETKLTEGQKQLGSINNILKSTIADLGDDAKGLHPFVRVSQRYLGTPYVWGGESARGFDCSGFIMRVMRDLGYKALPHSAAAQFNYGTPIAKPLLKPGDIVFFANTYKRGVSHVGIYLGRGRFIHAANSKQGTIVSGLNEPKWVKHYAGARRLVHQ